MCHVVPGQGILLTAPVPEHHPTPPVQRQLHISRDVPRAAKSMAAGNGHQEQNTGSDSSKLPAPHCIAGAVQPLKCGSRWLAVQVDSSRTELGRSTVHSIRGKHRFMAAWAVLLCSTSTASDGGSGVVLKCSTTMHQHVHSLTWQAPNTAHMSIEQLWSLRRVGWSYKSKWVLITANSCCPSTGIDAAGSAQRYHLDTCIPSCASHPILLPA